MATSSSSEPTDSKSTDQQPTDEAVVSEPTTSRTSEQPTVAPVAATTESAASESAATESASTEPATPEATAPAQPTVVFVQAPQPPKKRGARGVGALVALLGAGVFALAYAVLVLLIALIGSPAGLAPAFQFLSSVTFFVPVIVFFFAYLLLIVIVNRAGWWAHVLGGFIVALVTWVGFVGAAIIAAGVLGGSNAEVGSVVLQQLTNPLGFAAAIAAREVPIWVGGSVSKRGRTARARNASNRAAYEQELAEHRATLSSNTAV